jgi:hypothetical protein
MSDDGLSKIVFEGTFLSANVNNETLALNDIIKYQVSSVDGTKTELQRMDAQAEINFVDIAEIIFLGQNITKSKGLSLLPPPPPIVAK